MAPFQEDDVAESRGGMRTRPSTVSSLSNVDAADPSESVRTGQVKTCNTTGLTQTLTFPVRRLRACQFKRPKFIPGPCSSIAAGLLLSFSVLVGTASAKDGAGFAHGYFTVAQAHAGEQTFETTCTICHGDHLQGKVGPALAGKQFLSVSQFQKLTAYYLYHFMSKHMPLNAPGSLTPVQYLDLMAYLLEENGYASGSHKLSADSAELKSIRIEPQH